MMKKVSGDLWSLKMVRNKIISEIAIDRVYYFREFRGCSKVGQLLMELIRVLLTPKILKIIIFNGLRIFKNYHEETSYC